MMTWSIGNRKVAIVLGFIASMSLIGGIAYATIPDSSGVFTGCVRNGTLRVIDFEAGQRCRGPETRVTWNQTGPQGPEGPPGDDSRGCGDITDSIVGTWDVTNYGQEATGQVSFNADGTYVVDSGTYEAGGTFAGNTVGTYEVVESGGAILFQYADPPWTRIAIVHCGSDDRIVTSVAGHTHGYESLTR